MNVHYIPVVVERALEHGFPIMPHFKLRAPGTITMLQFLEKIRARLKLPLMQAVHFILATGLPVGMNQTLKNVYQNNRSKQGLLHLTCVSESTFGCHPPYEKPVTSKFPGVEALPFGAPEPEPSLYFPDIFEVLQVPEAPMVPAMWQGVGSLITDVHEASEWFQSLANAEQQDQYNEPWPDTFNLPVLVHPSFPPLQQSLVPFQSSTSLSELMDDISEASSDEEFNNSHSQVDLAQVMAHLIYVAENHLPSEEEET